MDFDLLPDPPCQVLRPQVLLVNYFESVDLLGVATADLVDESGGSTAQLPHNLILREH